MPEHSQKVEKFHELQVRFSSKMCRAIFEHVFVSGLDPARPMFEERSNPESSLDVTDARFVDIIHSSAGTLGFRKPIGHVDFFPNSGKASQPGCKGMFKEIMGK